MKGKEQQVCHLTRKDFLRGAAIVGAVALTSNLLPPEARAASDQEFDLSPSKLETLFYAYTDQIKEGVEIYRKLHPRENHPLLTPPYLRALAFFASGNKPTFVGGISPRQELIGLMRIHKKNAVLDNGEKIDLTDPVWSTVRAMEILNTLLQRRKGNRNQTTETLYDYLDGPFRKGVSDETSQLVGYLLLCATAKQPLEIENFLQFLLSSQEARSLFLSRFLEGWRYHQLQPVWPINLRVVQGVIANFGEPTRFQPQGHTGWDVTVRTPSDCRVLSVAEGKVVWANWLYGPPNTHLGHGYTVVIKHPGNPPLYTVYAHLDQNQPLVARGQRVDKGEVIGIVGDNTQPRGASSGPHLHFAVYRLKSNSPKEPLIMVTYEEGRNGREISAQLRGGEWIHPLNMLPPQSNYPDTRSHSHPVPSPSFSPQSLKKEAAPTNEETGQELLERLGLKGKILLVVYGRPGAHGSLGISTTAEGSWARAKFRRSQIVSILPRVGSLGKYNPKPTSQDILLAINPVDRARWANGKLSPELSQSYLLKALELAKKNEGFVLIDLGVEGEKKAKERIKEIEKMVKNKFLHNPQEAARLLSRLGLTWDLEWMPGPEKNYPCELNDTNLWFAQKHWQWNQEAGIATPGIIGIYAFKPTVNLRGVRQYYPQHNTIVVPIFDGYGNPKSKLDRVAQFCRQLEQGRTKEEIENNPPLTGAMDFVLLWGGRKAYDTGSTEENLKKVLFGAPVVVLAIQ